LVTEDVDDFGESDLRAAGISAVNPDLFLAEVATTAGYRAAVELMSLGMTHPPRSPEELHRKLGRQHPLTVTAHALAFAAKPDPPTHNPPAVLFRGCRCLSCTRIADRLELGICWSCRNPGQ
jgi:hypothetical protein